MRSVFGVVSRMSVMLSEPRLPTDHQKIDKTARNEGTRT